MPAQPAGALRAAPALRLPPQAPVGSRGLREARIPMRPAHPVQLRGQPSCRRARLHAGNWAPGQAKGPGSPPALPAPSPPALTLTLGTRTRVGPRGSAWGRAEAGKRSMLTLGGRFGFSRWRGHRGRGSRAQGRGRVRSAGMGLGAPRILRPARPAGGAREARRSGPGGGGGSARIWREGLSAGRAGPPCVPPYARHTAPGLRSAPPSRGAGAGGPKPSWP